MSVQKIVFWHFRLWKITRTDGHDLLSHLKMNKKKQKEETKVKTVKIRKKTGVNEWKEKCEHKDEEWVGKRTSMKEPFSDGCDPETQMRAGYGGANRGRLRELQMGATAHCGPEQPRIQSEVLGHLLTRSLAPLTRLLARSLCSLVGKWWLFYQCFSLIWPIVMWDEQEGQTGNEDKEDKVEQGRIHGTRCA